MAQRRPITSHPAFAPLLALWFAALLGLGVAVLPAVLLARLLDGTGLAALASPTTGGRAAVSAAAALAGGLLGWGLARGLARRGMRDPRPIYDEPEPLETGSIAAEPARRRPLVRDDLPDEPAEAAGVEPTDEPRHGPDGKAATAGPEWSPAFGDGGARRAVAGESDEGFMILSPQPPHPPRPAPDLEALLERFDDALAAFAEDDAGLAVGASGRDSAADPVRAFVARQTGNPAPSPLGGRMPDHQAELRAALDKLARTKSED